MVYLKMGTDNKDRLAEGKEFNRLLGERTHR